MRIAICDDETVFMDFFCNLLKAEFSRLNLSVDCVCFDNGKNFLQVYIASKFDAVFLDIDMPEISGFLLAQEIVAESKRPFLIFVTSREDLVYESFQYQPFAFLRKKYLEQEVQEVIRRISENIKSGDRFIMIKINKEVIKLKTSNTIYIENKKNDIEIHTINKIYTVRETISKMEKELQSDHFVRIHSGYLVNCKFIYSIKSNSLILEDKTELPISRRKISDTKLQFQRYMRNYNE